MKRLRFALPVLAVLAFVVATGIPAPSRATSTLVPTFATWFGPLSGSLNSSHFEITGTQVGGSSLTYEDLSLSDFDPAGPDSMAILNYEANSSFVVTFDSPVTNLAIYYRYLRGTPDGFAAFEMNAVQGSQTGTWSVLSGLSGASFDCNYSLNISGTTDAFLNGIAFYSGTLSKIEFASSQSSTTSLQGLTFATLAEPPAPTTSTTLAATTTTTVSTERQTPSFAC